MSLQVQLIKRSPRTEVILAKKLPDPQQDMVTVEILWIKEWSISLGMQMESSQIQIQKTVTALLHRQRKV